MAITLHLKPEVEAGLLSRAHADGKTVEEYLLRLVEGVQPQPARRRSPEERGELFRQWAADHPSTPLLSDYAVSRESMYQLTTSNASEK